MLAWIDEDTNLMWELKNTNNIGFQYVWHTRYIKEAPTNAGIKYESEVKDCTSYVARLNEQKHAGFSDWRLPTKEELESLIDQEGVGLYIKKPLRYNTWPAYWTSTPTLVVDVYKIHGVDWRNSAHIPLIYIVDFVKPSTLGYKPGNSLWVRCVRSVNN